jgi:hypothetical protein
MSVRLGGVRFALRFRDGGLGRTRVAAFRFGLALLQVGLTTRAEPRAGVKAISNPIADRMLSSERVVTGRQ